MKVRRITALSAAAVLSAAMLAGCGNDRLENELDYRQVGINAMAEGDYEKAVTAFNTALKQRIGKVTDTEIDICFYKAAAQFAGGDTDAALETYNALLDYDDTNGDAYYLRGTLYLGQGDYEKALSDYDNAVKYGGSDYERYVYIYENLSAHNLTEDGEKYLNQAFSIKGDSAENLMWRGRIYYLLGEYDNAKTELLASLEKENAQANLYLAQVCEAQGDADGAAAYYQAYVDTGVIDAKALNALGEYEMSREDYSAALTYFIQGLSMDEVPNRQELMQNGILCYEYTGDFDAAYEMAQEYITLYPDDEKAERECTFLSTRKTPEETAATDTETTEAVEETEHTEDLEPAETQ